MKYFLNFSKLNKKTVYKKFSIIFFFNAKLPSKFATSLDNFIKIYFEFNYST